MTPHPQCDECRTLLAELQAAYDEVASSPDRRVALQADCEVFSRMLQGSEEAADELFARRPFRANSPELLQPPEFRNARIYQALSRLFAHAVRTGHSGLFYRR